MIKIIKNQRDYEAALERIDQIIDSEPGSEEADELEVLGLLVSDYEDSNVIIGSPTIPEAVKFEMDRLGLSQKDLIPFIGSRSKVSEILSGKLQPSLRMMRALNKHLGIAAEVLLQDPAASFPAQQVSLDCAKFPLKEMAKRKWIDGPGKNLEDYAEEIVRPFFEKAGGITSVAEPVFRSTRSPRQNARRDPYAVIAWCLRLIIMSRENPVDTSYKPGIVDMEFMRHLAKFSSVPSGPIAAVEFLAQHGINVVFEDQLSKCYIDGVAMMTSDDKPVIGMTLRFDRIDNFWFCLFHELAHIAQHFKLGDLLFIDDLSLKENSGEKKDVKEIEADDMAEEALLPVSEWDRHPISHNPSVENMLDLSSQLKINPAIVAGRARYKFNNYRLLARHVGHNQIRKLFKA